MSDLLAYLLAGGGLLAILALLSKGSSEKVKNLVNKVKTEDKTLSQFQANLKGKIKHKKDNLPTEPDKAEDLTTDEVEDHWND